MWRQAADDPASAQTDKGIRAANRAADDGLIQNLRWTLVPFGPVDRRWHQSLGFTGDLGTVTQSDRNQPNVAQTSEAGDPADGPVTQSGFWHEMLESFFGADRNLAGRSGQGAH